MSTTYVSALSAILIRYMISYSFFYIAEHRGVERSVYHHLIGIVTKPTVVIALNPLLRVDSFLLDEVKLPKLLADWNHNNVFYLPLTDRNKYLRILIPNPSHRQDQI